MWVVFRKLAISESIITLEHDFGAKCGFQCWLDMLSPSYRFLLEVNVWRCVRSFIRFALLWFCYFGMALGECMHYAESCCWVDYLVIVHHLFIHFNCGLLLELKLCGRNKERCKRTNERGKQWIWWQCYSQCCKWAESVWNDIVLSIA